MIKIVIPYWLIAILAGAAIPLWVASIYVFPYFSHEYILWFIQDHQTPLSQIITAFIGGTFAIFTGWFVLRAAQTNASGAMYSADMAAKTQHALSKELRTRRMIGWLSTYTDYIDILNENAFVLHTKIIGYVNDANATEEELEFFSEASKIKEFKPFGVDYNSYEFFGSLPTAFDQASKILYEKLTVLKWDLMDFINCYSQIPENRFPHEIINPEHGTDPSKIAENAATLLQEINICSGEIKNILVRYKDKLRVELGTLTQPD